MIIKHPLLLLINQIKQTAPNKPVSQLHDYLNEHENELLSMQDKLFNANK
jgi:hypothetical protein